MRQRVVGRFLVVFLVVFCLGLAAMLVGAIQATNVNPAALARGGFGGGAGAGAGAGPLPWPERPPSDTPRPWPAPSMINSMESRGYVRIDAWAGIPAVPATAGTPGSPGVTTHQMQVERFGWPVPVLERVQLWWPWNDPNFATAVPNDSGLRIRWPSLIGAPVVAAVVIASLAVVPFRLAKRRRGRQGQCPWCGYDIRGAERCPECGARIPPAVLARSRQLTEDATVSPATTG